MTREWQTIPSLPESRDLAFGLMLGKEPVVVGGRSDDELVLDTVVKFDADVWAWVQIHRLQTPRAVAAGAKLHDGSLLVTGGYSSFEEDSSEEFVAASTSERFRVDTGSVAQSSLGATYYRRHTVTTLHDGTVLLAGGRDRYRENEPSDVEVYLPETDTWKPTSPLPESRSSHEATLLLDGRVLITGGQDLGNHPMATTLLYDPVSNQWSDSGSLSEARKGHSATLLPNGSVFVAGGVDNLSNRLHSAELFDSTSQRWRNVASMPFARSGHGAAPLPDGRILLIGGATGETWRSSVVLSTTVVYDPKTDTWLDGPSLPAARSDALVLWNEESIYVIGGYDENSQPTDTVFRLNR